MKPYIYIIGAGADASPFPRPPTSRPSGRPCAPMARSAAPASGKQIRQPCSCKGRLTFEGLRCTTKNIQLYLPTWFLPTPFPCSRFLRGPQDIEFYFLHWITDLAGADGSPAPRRVVGARCRGCLGGTVSGREGGGDRLAGRGTGGGVASRREATSGLWEMQGFVGLSVPPPPPSRPTPYKPEPHQPNQTHKTLKKPAPPTRRSSAEAPGRHGEARAEDASSGAPAHFTQP